MSKKFRIGFFLITAVLVGVVIYLSIELYKKEPKPKNELSNNSTYNTNTAKQNTTVTNTSVSNELTNNIIDNSVVNNAISNEVVSNGAIDETKAITIVKQNWGEDNSVYFRCDGKTNSGRYIISVRDRNTTNALNYYEVDPETGNFDIR